MKWATFISPYLTYLNNKKKIYPPDVHEQIMRYSWLNRLWIFGIWLLYSPFVIPMFIFYFIWFIFQIIADLFEWLVDKLTDLAILLGSHKLEKRRLAWVQTKRDWIKKIEHDQENEEPTGI